jgi:hypothetical protein
LLRWTYRERSLRLLRPTRCATDGHESSTVLQKQVSCSFTPEGEGRREDYDGSISKYGLDLGLTHGSRMLWIVFTNTVAGPGFLAGDYFGATGEATVGAGLGANVLVGGSDRTVNLQPISLSGQTGLNLAIGVAALQLGLPRQ